MKNTIKSQIAVMQGVVPSGKPQSVLAQFILGQVKGGEAAHDYAMSVIRTAINQAYKGNMRNIPEAVAMLAAPGLGKTAQAKARPYVAGFQAIADLIKPIAYTGKLDAASNAGVRDAIDSATEHASAEFERAYLVTVELVREERAALRAEKAAEAAAGAGSTEGSTEGGDSVSDVAGADQALSTVTLAEVDTGAAVEAVAMAIRAGNLTADELEMIRVAMASLEQYGANVPEPEALAA